MKEQITHLSLDERHRRVLAMRSAQLGLTLTAYISGLIDDDADAAGLLAFLSNPTGGKAVPRGE